MRRPSTSTRLKIAYTALAAVDTWLSARPEPLARRARFVTKPLLMPTVAASLATDRRADHSPLRTTTLLGQLGGWGGDVALLGEGTTPFLVGVGSFGLGHVAYLTGFWRRREHGPLRTDRAVRGVTTAWALTAPPIAFLAGRQERALGAPVLGYASLLALMTATANHLDHDLPAAARRLTAAGAVLFMVSDTILALRAFVLSDEASPAWETAVMATYTSAQLLLSEGAARA